MHACIPAPHFSVVGKQAIDNTVTVASPGMEKCESNPRQVSGSLPWEPRSINGLCRPFCPCQVRARGGRVVISEPTLLPHSRLISSSGENVPRYVVVAGLVGRKQDLGCSPRLFTQCLDVMLLEGSSREQCSVPDVFGRFVECLAKQLEPIEAEALP